MGVTPETDNKPNLAHVALCLCSATNEANARSCKFWDNPHDSGWCGYRSKTMYPTCNCTDANTEAMCHRIKREPFGWVMKLLTHDIELENHKWCED